MRNHPGYTRRVLARAALVASGITVAWLLAEALLRVFSPYSVTTIGHVYAENARRYGWGYSPHELIRLCDPDTGEVFLSMANNHGWRDRDRDYVNATGAFRILVLGDSVTFGAIVPDDAVMTRLLESRLRADGIHAEVINMSYGGWSTDQELEALMLEGVLYKPDLIVVQFCSNDLVCHRQGAAGLHDMKPFYYDLNAESELIRHDDPLFTRHAAAPRNVAIGLLKSSEVFKRLYSLFIVRRYGQISKAPPKGCDSERTYPYRVTNTRLEQLKVVLNLDSWAHLITALERRTDSDVPYDEITRIVRDAGMDEHMSTVLRILEKRWFQEGWSRSAYRPAPPDTTTPEWRLYFTLLAKIRDVARQQGARVALFCETDRGHVDWDLSWRRISPDVASQANSLKHYDILKSYAKTNGIDFIETTRLYIRARNDPHPNRQGCEAMAQDIYDHLRSDYAADLERHRHQPAAPR